MKQYLTRLLYDLMISGTFLGSSKIVPYNIIKSTHTRETVTARVPGGRTVIFPLECFRIACWWVPYFLACIDISEHLCVTEYLFNRQLCNVCVSICMCTRLYTCRVNAQCTNCMSAGAVDNPIGWSANPWEAEQTNGEFEGGSSTT